MNQTLHITNQAELEQLIERYFDGETTVQEEQMLREMLADCPWSSEVIDEARFTLGYFATHINQVQRARRRLAYRRTTGIAATIAIIIGIGAFATWHQQQSEGNLCVAYVNGHTINDNDAIMTLIENDLSNIYNASQGMQAQLSSLGEAIELDNE